MVRIRPEFSDQIKKFGGVDFNVCYNCGNCTAVCPLSENDNTFPRRLLRYTVLGMEEDIQSSSDPWLCYYCGDCSETCPRQANPGEIMMALRRYLTASYDWTGLSKKFYTSKAWGIGSLLLISVIVAMLFAFFLPFSADPAGMINEDGGVMINSFVRGIEGERFVRIIETGDLVMAAIISFFLISNIFNMYLKIVIRNRKKVRVPVSLYVREAWNLFYHFGTQMRFSKCEGRSYWVLHWLLMSGYTLMFTVIVVFLPWFQTEKIHPFYHPQRFIGYYATFGILLAIIVWSVGRLRRSGEIHKYSHKTDWVFLIMLFLTTLTGILLHLFRINGMVHATYYTYVVHLAILVPMLLVEVPFSKWSHLAYRPLAIYFTNLVNKAADSGKNGN
ncbi:MAG: 4Fe-4S dicluster domain-containing protein [Candidatus Krumholzibacteriota bacterium]|nr:4Fe-4S dicluster domain-containing protein [Candidatus Krumholzibacteriota bacterium]